MTPQCSSHATERLSSSPPLTLVVGSALPVSLASTCAYLRGRRATACNLAGSSSPSQTSHGGPRTRERELPCGQDFHQFLSKRTRGGWPLTSEKRRSPTLSVPLCTLDILRSRYSLITSKMVKLIGYSSHPRCLSDAALSQPPRTRGTRRCRRYREWRTRQAPLPNQLPRRRGPYTSVCRLRGCFVMIGEPAVPTSSEQCQDMVDARAQARQREGGNSRDPGWPQGSVGEVVGSRKAALRVSKATRWLQLPSLARARLPVVSPSSTALDPAGE